MDPPPADAASGEEDLGEPEEIWRSATDEPRPSHRRCVLHVDIDCFYAQVEMLERPELRDRPLGIQQKNIVVTSNYTARARGVGKCCLVADALRACPELVLVNGSDLTRYRRMSARIHRVLARFSRRVERLGFDENFLDVTEAVAARLAAGAPDPLPGHALGGCDSCACGCGARLTAAAHLATEARRALRDELGISSCAGVGFNKLLAKLAGAAHKPDQQTAVFAGGVDALLLGAGAVRALPGVGARTAAQLAELDVRTVSELRQAPVAGLQRALGRAAAAVRALAFGVDAAEVKTSSAALSIGVEDGFKRVDNVEECELKVRELARRVLVLLEEDGRVPTVMKLSIRRYHKDNYYRFRESRQTKVSPSLFARGHTEDVEVVDRVVAEAMALLSKMLRDGPFHLTLLGIAVTGFSEKSEPEQAGIARFVQKAASAANKRKSLADSASDRDATTPGGVDRSVWDSLPPDIQSELLRDQELTPSKRRKQQSIASFFGGASGSSSDLRTEPDVATLTEDSDCEVLSEAGGGAEGVCGLSSRSSSCSPVEVLEDRGDSGSDPDDPGSPVISRSVVTKSEVKSEGGSSADGDGLAGERETVASRSAKAGPPAGALFTDSPPGALSETVCTERAETDPPSDAVKEETSVSSVTAGAGRPTVPGRGSAPSAARSAVSDPACPGPPSPDRQSAACAADLPSPATGTDDWDQDVFSQLPPDIQFELKMARRTERQVPTPPRARGCPRKPAGAAAGAKAGPILKFFKK